MEPKYRPIESRQFPGWYAIPGYPNNLANKRGEIMNVKTGKFTIGGNAGRYLKVKVYRGEDEFPTMQYVHELVCRAFNGPRPGTAIVSHIDSNKKNNLWTNLEWDSQSNNVKISYVERRNRIAMESDAISQWSKYVNIALEFLDDSIQRVEVHSSNITSIGYDKESRILEVEFKNYSVYQYFDVPIGVYKKLLAVSEEGEHYLPSSKDTNSSVGKYFHQFVKGKYAYTKV